MELTNQERRYFRALQRRRNWIVKKLERLREEDDGAGIIGYLDEERAALEWVFRMVAEVEDVPHDRVG